MATMQKILAILLHGINKKYYLCFNKPSYLIEKAFLYFNNIFLIMFI